MNAPHSNPPHPELSPRVRLYLDAIIEACNRNSRTLVSAVLFGSAAKGGFAQQVSDVDVIAVLSDEASQEESARVQADIHRLEIEHGFRKPALPRNLLQGFAERMGNGLSSFICTRRDLISGDVGGVFDLTPAEAFFVDRIVLASVVASSVTIWGEDLLQNVHLKPIRRLDVFKAWFALSSQVSMSLVAHALLPEPTRYAMGALKRSLHSCYFCYHLNTAPLSEEVSFFLQRLGRTRVLEQLLELRSAYRDSSVFAMRCLPALLRLHLRTTLDNNFPMKVAVGESP